MIRRPRVFLIWGAGGHGKIVAELVRACGDEVAGFVEIDPAKIGRRAEPGGAHVVLQQGDLLKRLRRHGSYPFGVDALALAIGDNRQRQRSLGRLGDCPVPPLVHPSAVVSPCAALGRGAVVCPGSVINSDAWIGQAVIVNTRAVIEHDCRVADAAHISPGAILAGGVEVGERSWIGAGATVIQGVVIGPDATVGAGAVVIRDVPGNTVVAGVPARPIRAEQSHRRWPS
jgi:sugar O-acyltransferase (sialic acid O-acetyltransferase NeuD family)